MLHVKVGVVPDATTQHFMLTWWQGESSGINLQMFMRDVVLLWFGMRKLNNGHAFACR